MGTQRGSRGGSTMVQEVTDEVYYRTHGIDSIPPPKRVAAKPAALRPLHQATGNKGTCTTAPEECGNYIPSYTFQKVGWTFDVINLFCTMCLVIDEPKTRGFMGWYMCMWYIFRAIVSNFMKQVVVAPKLVHVFIKHLSCLALPSCLVFTGFCHVIFYRYWNDEEAVDVLMTDNVLFVLYKPVVSFIKDWFQHFMALHSLCFAFGFQAVIYFFSNTRVEFKDYKPKSTPMKLNRFVRQGIVMMLMAASILTLTTMLESPTLKFQSANLITINNSSRAKCVDLFQANKGNTTEFYEAAMGITEATESLHATLKAYGHNSMEWKSIIYDNTVTRNEYFLKGTCTTKFDNLTQRALQWGNHVSCAVGEIWRHRDGANRKLAEAVEQWTKATLGWTSTCVLGGAQAVAATIASGSIGRYAETAGIVVANQFQDPEGDTATDFVKETKPDRCAHFQEGTPKHLKSTDLHRKFVLKNEGIQVQIAILCFQTLGQLVLCMHDFYIWDDDKQEDRESTAWLVSSTILWNTAIAFWFWFSAAVASMAIWNLKQGTVSLVNVTVSWLLLFFTYLARQVWCSYRPNQAPVESTEDQNKDAEQQKIKKQKNKKAVIKKEPKRK